VTLRATSGAIAVPVNTCQGCGLHFDDAAALGAHRVAWHCGDCGALYPSETSPACFQCGTRRDDAGSS
jgi:hypothetical protein